MGFLQWFAQHWFTLLQSAGIIGGLLFTAFSLRIDTTARRIGNLIAVTHEHRDLWKQPYERPELWRVLDNKVDLRKAPPTEEEKLFVNLLVLHLDSAFEAMKAGMFVEVPGLREDVRHFFSLPIPRAAWEGIKPLQRPDLVAFIEGSLGDAGG